MHELTGGTKIRLSQIDWSSYLPIILDKHSKYKIGDRAVWKDGVYEKTHQGWKKVKQPEYSEKRKTYKDLAKKAEKAHGDGQLESPTVSGAQKYMKELMRSWKVNPVKSPLFNNARIRMDRTSYDHLFEQKPGVQRPPSDIVRRAKCLPYLRDILERAGKLAGRSVDKYKDEIFTVVGKGDIDGKEKGIKALVVKRNNSGHYFHLSVMDFKII